MTRILATVFSLFLFALTPALVFAQSGYGGPYEPDFTAVEPSTVSCRVLYEDTGRIEEERMELTVLEIIQTCESGAVAFIVPSDEIEQVAGAEPISLPEQEGDN